MRSDKLLENSRIYFDGVAAKGEQIDEPVLCYEETLRYLEGHVHGCVLDLGCGTGEMLVRLAERYPDLKLTGADLSPASLEVAKKKLRPCDRLIEADAQHLPFEDASFDELLCMHSFHHYPHPKRVMKEIRRVLREDGLFYLVENDYPFFFRTYVNFSFVVKRHPQGDRWMYSPRKLVRMGKRAGLELIETRPMAAHSRIFIMKRSAAEKEKR